MKDVEENSVDLIVTSPPYADRRAKTYGGVKPEEYVSWFLPRSKEFLRVLKPDGTFILNIKEKVENGERHTFVIDLILALRQQGWLWTEEFIWHKKNSYPGKWPNRFRDSWERLLQFNKTRKFKMYQDEVRVPMGEWARSRLKKLSETDKRQKNWIGRELAYPSNVLHLATETGNKSHSAVFPKELPAWFIRLFTKPGDMVLDPFLGSGTTCIAALDLDRKSMGIEIFDEYYDLAKNNIEKHLSRYQLKGKTPLPYAEINISGNI